MNKMGILALALTLTVAITGCGKKDNGGEGGGGGGTGTVATVPPPVNQNHQNSNCLPDDFNQGANGYQNGYQNGYPGGYQQNGYYRYQGQWTPGQGWQHHYGWTDQAPGAGQNWGRFCRCQVGFIPTWDQPNNPRCIPVSMALGTPGAVCSLTDLNSCGPYGICEVGFDSWQTGKGRCL